MAHNPRLVRNEDKIEEYRNAIPEWIKRPEPPRYNRSSAFQLWKTASHPRRSPLVCDEGDFPFPKPIRGTISSLETAGIWRMSVKALRVRCVIILRGATVVGALLSVFPNTGHAGPDACTGVGTVTCSGDQSEGVINPPSGTTTLIVNSLTRDIAPATDIPGIIFRRRGNIALNSNTDPFQIIQSQAAAGIDVESISSGAVTVSSSGNIQAIHAINIGFPGISALYRQSLHSRP
jgi:hypothetical protein